MAKVVKLDFEERNLLYFKIKDTIEANESHDAAKKILTEFLELLKGYNEEGEIEAVEAKINPEPVLKKAVFRRT